MDPDLLRFMTDPEARKDPVFAAAMARKMRQDGRKRALSSLRLNTMLMGGLGALFVLGGLGLGAGAALAGFVPGISVGLPPAAAAGAGALLLFLGTVFVAFALVFAMPSDALARTGAPGTAVVREVTKIGLSVNVGGRGRHHTGTSLSRITVLLGVTPASGAPFEISHREFMLSSDIKHLQRGATIPVRLAPGNARLTIDWDAMED